MSAKGNKSQAIHFFLAHPHPEWPLTEPQPTEAETQLSGQTLHVSETSSDNKGWFGTPGVSYRWSHWYNIVHIALENHLRRWMDGWMDFSQVILRQPLTSWFVLGQEPPHPCCEPMCPGLAGGPAVQEGSPVSQLPLLGLNCRCGLEVEF